MDLKKLRDLGDERFKVRQMDAYHVRTMRVQKIAYFDGIEETLKELDMKDELKEWDKLLNE